MCYSHQGGRTLVPDLTALPFCRIAKTTSTATRLSMQFAITPHWDETLRIDVEEWDDRVKEGQKTERFSEPQRWKWTWPELTPPLKYTGSETEQVSRT